MMEIWVESGKFHSNKKLADKARLILKKGVFSDLKILKICGPVNRKEHAQRELPKRIEAHHFENQNTAELKNSSILAQSLHYNL